VIPCSDDWVYDLDGRNRDIVFVPCHLHKLAQEGAEVRAGGQTFTLTDWRGTLKREPRGTRDVSTQDRQIEAWIRAVGYYRCRLLEPRPFPETYVNYPDFYLKLDTFRLPFIGRKWKVFSCRIDRTEDDSDIIREVDHSAPMDTNLQHSGVKILREDVRRLHDQALRLREAGVTTPPANRSLVDKCGPSLSPASSTGSSETWSPKAERKRSASDVAPKTPITIDQEMTPVKPRRLSARAVEMMEEEFHASDRPKSWWMDFFLGVEAEFPVASEALRRVAAED